MHNPRAANVLAFRVLFRVFFLRVIDLDLLSPEADTTRLIGQFASLLVAISFIFTAPLILMGGTLPQSALWTMEHFLLSITISVVGLFSVLSWDSFTPDRRDLFVLAPLPVPFSILFSAKVSAVAAALGLTIVSLNAFTGLIWPLLFLPTTANPVGLLRSFSAYWITLSLAGIFTFCSILVLQGLFLQLLPRQLYLRFSAVLQIILCFLFIAILFLEPSFNTPEAFTTPANQALLAWLPSFWFLGLFQELNGSMHPALSSMAHRAWLGAALAVAASLASLVLFYLRTLGKIVEQPDIAPGQSRHSWPLRRGNSLDAAILDFTLGTLVRSRQHRLIASFYLGIGCAAVLAYVRVPRGTAVAEEHVAFLSASILILAIAVAGVRVVYSLPVAIAANWIFRITELEPADRYVSAVRRSIFWLILAPLILATTLPALLLWPSWPAIVHLAALGLLGGVLVELSLRKFQQIPFTCAYLPGKANVNFTFFACILLVIPLINAAAEQEERILRSPLASSGMIAVLALAWALAHRRARLSPGASTRLRFESANEPEILALKLEPSRY